MIQLSSKIGRYDKMKEASVEKLTLQMAVPAIISMLTTTIYNMADTYFVGQVGTYAIAAVGIAFSFMSIVQAFGFLYGHGSGNYLGKMLGKGDSEAASQMAVLGMLFSMGTGILLAIGCMAKSEDIAGFLGADSSVREETGDYLRALAIGIPFMAGALTLNNQLRFQGSAFYGMVGTGIGGLLNIILDPIMIFGLNMGVTGAGVATALSQIISFFVLVVLNKRRNHISLSFNKWHFSKGLLQPLIWGGMPNFSRQAIAAVAAICLNTLAARYGAETIAAFTVVNRLIMMVGAVMIGLGQGFQPVCAYNYGAGLYSRVRRSFIFAVSMTTVYSLVMMGILLVDTPKLLGLFSNDAKVIDNGVVILRCQGISFPILGWVIICGMFLQNIGRFKRATLVSAARQGICFFPLAAILPCFLGFWGVVLVQPLADIGTFLISLPFGIKAIKELSN